MDEKSAAFIEKECEYLRDEVKLHVAETNSLAKNSILFTAGTISILFLNEKLSIPGSIKTYFMWLPLAINILMGIRALTLGVKIIKISRYIEEIEIDVLGSESNFGWERRTNKDRGKRLKGMTNETIAWTVFWLAIVFFSFILALIFSERADDTAKKVTTEAPSTPKSGLKDSLNFKL